MHMSQAHVRQGRLRLQPGACSPHLRALFLGSEEFKDATLTSPDNFSILPDDSPAPASSTSKGAPPTMMVQKTLYDRCQQQHAGADNQGDGEADLGPEWTAESSSWHTVTLLLRVAFVAARAQAKVQCRSHEESGR